jgi:hypothetical protein
MASTESLQVILNAAVESHAEQQKRPRQRCSQSMLTASEAWDVQVTLACMNLIYAIVCVSPSSRLWLVAPQGGQHYLRRLLPLLLHPLITARRSAARMMAAVIFLGEAYKWSKWISSRGTSQDLDGAHYGHGSSLKLSSDSNLRQHLFCLPSVFDAGFLMPFRVSWFKVQAQSHVHEQQVGNVLIPLKTSKLQGIDCPET